MFKLISAEIVDGELVLNLKADIDFNSESAGEFLSDNFKKLKRQVQKIINTSNINFRDGKVKVLVNGALLTTLLVSSGHNIKQTDGNVAKYDNETREVAENEDYLNETTPGEITIIPPATTPNNPTAPPASQLKVMNLALIAGHSGRTADPGAVYNNRYESDYTQELVSLITNQLKNKSNINVNVILEPSNMALAEEMSFLKSSIADYAISVHFNAGGGSGSEIIVPYHTSDLTIAQKTIENFRAINQPIRPTALYSRSSNGKTPRENGKGVTSQRDYYGIIRAGTDKKIHSEIIEVEFIDNESNMKYYDQNKIKYAKAIADAVESYYLKNYKN